MTILRTKLVWGGTKFECYESLYVKKNVIKLYIDEVLWVIEVDKVLY